MATGITATREEAQTAFADTWRRWLTMTGAGEDDPV
jgi:hypothetical protein